jgi:hypothetical protein
MLVSEIANLFTLMVQTAGQLVWAFVGAVLLAAFLNAFRLDQAVSQLFARSPAWSIVGAVLLGLVSPL